MEPNSPSALPPSYRLASVSAQLSTVGRQAIMGGSLQFSLPEVQAASLRQPAVCSAGQPPGSKAGGSSSRSNKSQGGSGRVGFNFSRRAAGFSIAAGAGAGAFLVRSHLAQSNCLVHIVQLLCGLRLAHQCT